MPILRHNNPTHVSVKRCEPVTMETLRNIGKYSPTRSQYIDFIGHMSNKCGDFYFDWLQCADRVGLQDSARLCRKSFEDYKECKFNSKMGQRLKAMDKERVRQNRPEIPMLYVDGEKYADGMNTERS